MKLIFTRKIKAYHIIFPMVMVLVISACVHEPIIPTIPNPNPGDTTVIDTTVIDTTTNDTTTNPPDTTANFRPCDPDTVYFTRDILPFLISNCAKSGCHDENSAQDGVILTSYEQVIQTADVKPGDLGDSDLYEVLVETDPDDKMPPPPNNPLSQDQVLLIQKWILQGAQNLTCEDSVVSGGCDTTNVSFSGFVDPLLTTYCKGCHTGAGASGGVNLGNHAGVVSAANSGRLYGAIAHQNGYVPMPQGGDPLPDCDVQKIKAWIDQGALNN
ncbi:MAG: c-type cytochrome [Bacteroidetes bacterium]|nr:c-type cytochrome [Bacteroidota bacterium]